MKVFSFLLRLSTAVVGAGCLLPNPQLFTDPSCTSNSDVATIVTLFVGTVPATNVHMTFEGDFDKCLLVSLWDLDIPVRVVSRHQLRSFFKLSSYTQPAQYIIVGGVGWITSVITEAKLFYADAAMNAEKTHWFWVVRESQPRTDLSLPWHRHHCQAVRKVEAVLFEGMRGLLICQENQKRLRGKNSRVVVHSVETVGDGSWRLRLAVSGTLSHLDTLRPLWPTPAYNLMGRRLRISCLKKPTVFLFNDGEQLADAQGYSADIVQEIKRQLNFTDVLVPNNGFGAYRNGSWNGMVADLLYGRADVSPLDFTPIWQRSLVIDFGRIYSTDDVVIISSAPRAFIRPLLLLQIFTPFVRIVTTGKF